MGPIASSMAVAPATASKGKSQSGDNGARGMPAAIVEEEKNPNATEEKIRKRQHIESAQPNSGMQKSPDHMQRREQERLRIGNHRPACEHVWRPPRPLAA